jgi:hypothetical protein
MRKWRMRFSVPVLRSSCYTLPEKNFFHSFDSFFVTSTLAKKVKCWHFTFDDLYGIFKNELLYLVISFQIVAEAFSLLPLNPHVLAQRLLFRSC